jgi:hypothetical protein
MFAKIEILLSLALGVSKQLLPFDALVGFWGVEDKRLFGYFVRTSKRHCCRSGLKLMRILWEELQLDGEEQINCNLMGLERSK